MATWPVSLPAMPRAGNWRSTPEKNVVEFAPDVGSPLRRRRYTAKRIMYRAEMVITSTQRNTLQSFFEVDCADGSLSFTMADWTTGLSSTFTWIGPPEFEHMSASVWRVGLNLAKEP